MAPRANWKGFCRLTSLLPGRVDPAHFRFREDQLQPEQPKTPGRIKYMKVDADHREDVPTKNIMKGYKVDTDTYIEVSKDELENIALESARPATLTSLCRRAASTARPTPFFLLAPYLVTDGKSATDAFAVISEPSEHGYGAIGRVV